ncbi:hypothetical protein [Streptomyces sp. NPDC051079]|uniref:hypothetical protein n=1 Tax=Streptomyces sp. NPDC051079 TaxID=3155043 RepID=UPI00344FC90D
MRHGTRRAFVTAAAALVLAGCTTVRPGPSGPPADTTRLGQDRLLKVAERSLVADCIGGRGLALPSRARAPAEDRRLPAALFGGDPREPSLTLANGLTVTADGDGCTTTARASLYGDQTCWFHAQVVPPPCRLPGTPGEAGAR